MEKNISENQLLNERGYKTKRKEVCVRRHASSKKKKTHTHTHKNTKKPVSPWYKTAVFFDVFRDNVGYGNDPSFFFDVFRDKVG